MFHSTKSRINSHQLNCTSDDYGYIVNIFLCGEENSKRNAVKPEIDGSNKVQ